MSDARILENEVGETARINLASVGRYAVALNGRILQAPTVEGLHQQAGPLGWKPAGEPAPDYDADARATIARTHAARGDGFELRDIRARFHRNGIAGEGFSALTFRCRIRGGGRAFWEMAAVVFDGPGRVAVIEPANVANCWRGDDFEPLLRRVVRAFDESGELFDSSRATNL